MRDEKGRFVKGTRPHPETEFKPGQPSWRPHQPFHEKVWLEAEYIGKQRSTGDIAKQFGVTDEAVLFWLRYHGIPRRSIAEARKAKHWGARGERNGMHGRSGQKNPNWKGGHSPERQAFYSSPEWAAAVIAVWARDKARCQRCGAPAKDHGSFTIHHIVGFAVAELRAEVSNLTLLCTPCHRWVHSRANVNREMLRERGGGEAT